MSQETLVRGVASIDALVEFVSEHSARGLDRNSELKRRLDDLDADAFAELTLAHLTVRDVPLEGQKRHYGNTKIPSQGTSDGFEVWATDNWLQTMRGLRAVVVARSALPAPTPGVTPITPETEPGEGAGKGIQGEKTPAPGGAKARKAKGDKPPTKRDKLREQRLAFCRPRRRKNLPEAWDDIFAAYRKKFPKDTDAGPDTLRLTFERWEGKYADE